MDAAAGLVRHYLTCWRERGGVDQDKLYFGEEPDAETEDDLEFPEPRSVTDAVVTSTDWTTETILNQLRRGNIHLTPRFQRRDAWTTSRKSRFIESIFLALPIPQLVLAERKEKRGSYLVIDGKQRLLSLLQFAGHEEEDGGFKPLSLTGLELRQDLNGLRFSEMEADPAFADEVTAFQNQTIRTVVVRNWPDEQFLYLVFLRLNTGSVPLSPQELRQALHPGPFVDFADDFSYENEYLYRALGLSAPDFRMRDVEVVVRFFGLAFFLSDYAGNLKDFLDKTCFKLNEAWSEDETRIRAEAESLNGAVDATLEIFNGSAFRRWNGERFEGRFNRAVFDVMTYYFKRPALAESARAKAQEVVQAFQTLSETDHRFDDALATTTKTVTATGHRLEAWGIRLGEVLGVDVPVPALVGNRIEPPSN